MKTDKEEFEDFLMHYGVKGMRWGVRKTSSQLRVTREKLEPKRINQAVRSSEAAVKANRLRAKVEKLDRKAGDLIPIHPERRKLDRLKVKESKARTRAEKEQRILDVLNMKAARLDQKILKRGKKRPKDC